MNRSLELEGADAAVYSTAWSIPADQLQRACEAFAAATFVRATRIEGGVCGADARLICEFDAPSASIAEARVRILKHELLYADVDCASVEFIS